MSDVTMTLDGFLLVVDGDGVIRGDHALVPLCNVRVRGTGYSPNRQQTAVLLLQRLGAVKNGDGRGDRLAGYLQDFDPLVWY